MLELVDEFKYLESVTVKRGKCGKEVESRVAQGRKVAGAMQVLVKEKKLSVQAARGLHEGVLVPTLTYGCETLVWHEREKSRVRAVEMDMLRGVCGVRRIDWVRNEVVRERCGVQKSVDQRVEESVLRWYGHVARMGDERIVKKVYEMNSRVLGGWADREDGMAW